MNTFVWICKNGIILGTSHEDLYCLNNLNSFPIDIENSTTRKNSALQKFSPILSTCPFCLKQKKKKQKKTKHNSLKSSTVSS